MKLPFKIISTDFDGTLHADFEDPPIPLDLQNILRSCQEHGAIWIINTGRDLSSLMETLGRARLDFWPDYVVTVEREIYCRQDSEYIGLSEWNDECANTHEDVFAQLKRDLPRLMQWVNSRFQATVYADAYSPFCLIAQNNEDADLIHTYLNEYCRQHPKLTVVRNDIYARFSHVAYNKGTALAEIGRRLGVTKDLIVVAGDHLNDLSMLSTDYARWIIAPSNAIETVKEAVRKQQGYISHLPHGSGVANGLQWILSQTLGPEAFLTGPGLK